MASYRPGTGWGDGRTNMIALKAILRLFSTAMPDQIQVVLTKDDHPLLTGRIAGAGRRQVSAWTVPLLGASGPQTWTLNATPAVAGLGYAVEVTYYVPWEDSPQPVGWGLELVGASQGRVGQPTVCTLRAMAPGQLPLVIRHVLPAGVEPDRGSLETLVREGLITGYTLESGAVIWKVPARPPGQTFVARYTVVPTLAGTLMSGASMVHPEGQPAQAAFVPPSAWHIQ